MRDWNDYNTELKDAQVFQDFVTVALLQKIGISLNQFCSLEFQNKVGESLSRIEIKHDKNIKITDRLWFDYEKRSTTDSEWHETGITSDDNRIFWIIGDYEELFLVMHSTIKRLFEDFCEYKNSFVRETTIPQRNGQPGKGAEIKTNDLNCARGFLLPVQWLLKRGYAIRIEVKDIAEEFRKKEIIP